MQFKNLKLLLVVLAIVGLFQVNVSYAPAEDLWGNPDYIRFDQQAMVYINNNPSMETWRYYGDTKLVLRMIQPERVPAKKQLRIVFNPIVADRRFVLVPVCAAGVVITSAPNRRRVHLINVEPKLAGEEDQYKVWPHQGLLYVGTAMKMAGWDVLTHDELVQGHCDLESVVQPGDVVALSVVVGRIDRALELARLAKQLGASKVVAGNDAVIYRANQLMALPDKPLDAVFVSNSLLSIGSYFRELGERGDVTRYILGVRTSPQGRDISNRREDLVNPGAEQTLLNLRSKEDLSDLFTVPDFSLFPQGYYETCQATYRRVFGHKHPNPDQVRAMLIHLAQGCTKIAGTCFCEYCTIYGSETIRIASDEHIRKLAELYGERGITHAFNTTDSAYEMQVIPDRLYAIGSPFRSMTIYGRSQGIARNPHLLEKWQRVAPERLVINVGMDSGDERMLRLGVSKSQPTIHEPGNLLRDNFEAIRLIKEAGAYLHFSLIFGSPGETEESCKRSQEFAYSAMATLGEQLDTVESDIFWLNHGSPASRVFTDYGYAQELAARAGKEISVSDWQANFATFADELNVPESVEEAWYRHFTGIELARAKELRTEVTEANKARGGIGSRAFQ